MQTLIIGPPSFQKEIDPVLTPAGSLTWANGLNEAFCRLEEFDIDLIIFDCRKLAADPTAELRALIAGIPVTTRVLAIVEQLPSEEIFAESGVVYLTPPVNLGDINWFIRSYREANIA